MPASKARRFREPTATGNIDKWYRKKLKQVSHQVSLIVKEYAEETNPLVAAMQIQSRLFSYADTLDSWANATARLMVQKVSRADLKVWDEVGKKIGIETRKRLKDVGIQSVYKRLQDEQVTLIKSIPQEAAKTVQDWVKKGLSDGIRYSDITKRIQSEIGGVTESRAVCIARTESARARTNFTQARAESIGSTHYRWHTVGDGSVRPMHEKLDNTIQRWDSPPVTDIGKGGQPIRATAGCVWNCRCWCEPLFDEDLFK